MRFYDTGIRCPDCGLCRVEVESIMRSMGRMVVRAECPCGWEAFLGQAPASMHPVTLVEEMVEGGKP